MEDAWLELVEGVSAGQGVQRVVLLLPSIIVQLLEVGQVFGQVSDSIMDVSEALHFGS
jgi:hypothetical protein